MGRARGSGVRSLWGSWRGQIEKGDANAAPEGAAAHSARPLRAAKHSMHSVPSMTRARACHAAPAAPQRAPPAPTAQCTEKEEERRAQRSAACAAQRRRSKAQRSAGAAKHRAQRSAHLQRLDERLLHPRSNVLVAAAVAPAGSRHHARGLRRRRRPGGVLKGRVRSRTEKKI